MKRKGSKSPSINARKAVAQRRKQQLMSQGYSAEKAEKIAKRRAGLKKRKRYPTKNS